MKKKIICAICLVLAAVVFLAGCSGLPRVNINNPQTDFDFAVQNNGSMAVQYGNYVYFINGTRGYLDEDGRQNRFGEVVKGGIYRAELFGQKSPGANGALSTWTKERDLPTPNLAKMTSSNSELLYDFTFEVQNRFNDPEVDEEIDWVLNEKIVPVTAGTSGYAQGGIFIYDDYIYFASPNNERNRQGAVQTERTDFIQMRLDGRNARRIFTTRGASAHLPYSFYKMGDSVFLVCAYENENGTLDLVSVRTRDRKIFNPVYLTQEAEQVYLPARPVYDKTSTRVGLEDYVFYTRSTAEDNRAGNTIEICRPDGSEGFSFHDTNNETRIEDVRDGLLFYTASGSGGETIARFTNLHDLLMVVPHATQARNASRQTRIQKVPDSLTYREYEDRQSAANRPVRAQFSGDAYTLLNYDDYSARYFFGDERHNGAYMLGISGDGVYLHSAIDTAYRDGVLIYDSTVEMLFVEEGYLYFLEGSAIYRTHIFTPFEDKEDGGRQLLTDEKMVVRAGITAAVVADHLVFFAIFDEFTRDGGYAHFVNLRRAGSLPFMVGTLSEDDQPDEEELEAFKDGRELIRDEENHDHG
ncbi:MAG: hypothetical protein FWH03_01875 [Firmicutes bacterium]|nr:hypothetical protein [Bacillota bacterium]